jgi:4-hydroxybenzoate polyprenyltransferase
LIAFYASAFAWIGSHGYPPPGIVWLMALSFFIGVVLEVGRKIKTADTERYGVETYSALWGQKRALVVWLAASFAAAVCYVAVWSCVGFATVCIGLAALMFAFTLWTARRFLAGQCAATHIEAVSALLGLGFYLGLTPLQLALPGVGL